MDCYTDAGTMYITYDSGEHWSRFIFEVPLPLLAILCGKGESVGFVSAVVGGNGRIYRTLDAGKNWMIEPASSAGSMPKVDKFNKLGVCKLDANQLFAVGLADNGTAGSIVVGGDSAG